MDCTHRLTKVKEFTHASARQRWAVRGFTLIELIVALAITAIISSVVILTLKTTLDSYFFSQEQVMVQKFLDDVIEEISGEKFSTYGIKDSLEITDAASDSITFIPLWMDNTHTVRFQPMQVASYELMPQEELYEISYTLNRPFKAGATFPLAEVVETVVGKDGNLIEKYRPVSTFFIINEDKTLRLNDKLVITDPLPAGSKLRFIFHPDATFYPECAVTIKYIDNKISYSYNNKTTYLPKTNLEKITIEEFKLSYYDNANNEIPLDETTKKIPKDQLSYITAVKIQLKINLSDATRPGSQGLPGIDTRRRSKERSSGVVEHIKTNDSFKEATSFINIRNARAAGIILREGSQINIPDSNNIRILSMGNIVGIKENSLIEIEIKSDQGQSWGVSVLLGFKDNQKVIKKFSISYPLGTTVLTKEINQSTDLPLNFLTIDPSGRYDYDYDKNSSNAVVLKGKTQLSVKRMDVSGASLFVRP